MRTIPHPRNPGPGVPESPPESETKVRLWGYPIVFKFKENPCAYYPPHFHERATTHYITRGQLELSFVDGEEKGHKKLNTGDRFDIPARQNVEITVGIDGCEYLVGSI
ncbi:Cupin, RmlC-type [Ascosphaera apis ARSEF 7405]|uniref:Cupin, RmlC-type n=1 Tax=Ascosphaera apis ARSEF 7405 TaxID=392613 RepID=A0A166NB56_9EURO|nr:Cupin, RmlC-type [Ascosphaera apis ARSEF 7405]